MKYQKGLITNYAIAIWLLIVVIGGIGFVKNIIVIAHSDFNHVTGMLLLRVIGVFLPPIGAVLGYL